MIDGRRKGLPKTGALVNETRLFCSSNHRIMKYIITQTIVQVMMYFPERDVHEEVGDMI